MSDDAPATDYAALAPCVRVMPIEEYHRAPGASKSRLDWVAKSPALVEWADKAPVDEDADKAVDIGSALHSLLLEPDQFTKEYVADFKAPDGAIVTTYDFQEALQARGVSFLKSASKKVLMETLLDHDPDAPVSDVLREAWEGSVNGREVLTLGDWRKLHLMRDSVMAHPTARKLLEADGHTERSHFWIDDLTGELCRCRIDREIPQFAAVLDIKTTADMQRFPRSAKRYRYPMQQVMYSEGYAATQGHPPAVFGFVVVSSTRDAGRYPVDVMYCSPGDLENASLELRRDLATWAAARKSGQWSGFHEMTLPPWD